MHRHKLWIVSFLGVVAMLAATVGVRAQVLFSEDFEGGSEGQFLHAAPFSWTREAIISDSVLRVANGNPIGDGLGINGNWHPVNSLGIYTQPVPSPVGDGVRLSADLHAGIRTMDNSFGLGNEALSNFGQASYDSGAFFRILSGQWQLDARGLGAPNIMRFENNPRGEVVRGTIDIDLTTQTITGTLTEASGVSQMLSTSLLVWKDPSELGAAETLDVISLVERGNPALSVDNILLEKLVLDLEWNKNASHSWNSASNWVPVNDVSATAVSPNTNASIARFGSVISGPRSVVVSSPVTVRRVDFDSPHAYTISGTNSVSFAARPRENARIDVNQGEHRFQAPVNLASNTVAVVPGDGELTFDGALHLNGKFLTKTDTGTMSINGQLARAESPVDGAVVLQAGTLNGVGAIDGYLTNIGSTVSPGNNHPGTLTVLGHYSQGPNGRDLPIVHPSLAININGVHADTQHDVLDVVGNMEIFGGSLDIAMGFTPSPGDSFDIFDFKSARGSFDSINGQPGANMLWDTSQLFVDGTISVIPKPTGSVLIEHVGANNPAMEQWNVESGPGGFGDPGPPANWRIVDNSEGFYRVINFDDEISDPIGWTASMTAKLNAGSEKNDAVMIVQDGVGNNVFHLQMVDGSGGDPKGAYYLNQTGEMVRIGGVDPTDGFHTYQIVLDAKGNTNAADDTATWYVDGVAAVGPLSRSDIQMPTDRTEILFGRVRVAAGASDSQHSWWRFETGQNVINIGVPEPGTAGLLVVALGIGAVVRRRREDRGGLGLKPNAMVKRCVSSISFVFLCSWSATPAQDLDRGHRVLLERGLQLQALSRPIQNGFNLARWNESNFTTIDLHYEPYPTFAQIPTGLHGLPWGRNMHHQEFYLDHDLFDQEMSHVSEMVRYQIQDEQDLTDPAQITRTAEIMDFLHQKYPDVLLNTDVGMSVIEMRNYMQQAKPDLLMNQSYPFFGGESTAGGSPTLLYENMATFRAAALGGNDGTGARPIPYGLFTQTFVRGGHTVSESEARLNNFAAWTFGYKLVDAFFYDAVNSGPDALEAVLFSGAGTASPTPLFYQLAETNRQSLNLGPALVRLVSTDVRMILGKNGPGQLNPLPTDVMTWNDAVDPYMTSIEATNLGSKNGGLPGDVVVGYFKPLDGVFTDPGAQDDRYFMILNGLSDSSSTGTVASTRQNIRIDFDFGTSGITRLQRLDRETGLVEPVNLVWDGGALFHLDLDLEGGTGDLFKFDTGSRFVSLPAPCDFNVDASCDLADIGLMFSQGNLVNGISATVNRKKFDLVLDGIIDGQDITAWLAASAHQSGYGSSYQRGDTDGLDLEFPQVRDIDVTDFSVLAANFDPAGALGMGNTWEKGNFDGDNDIDITDFNFLASHFAPSGYGMTTGVPEPSSMYLGLLSLIGMAGGISWRKGLWR